MIRLLMVLWIMALLAGCETVTEYPVELSGAPEPSANLHNKEGIAEFRRGHYEAAWRHFLQANTADRKNGDIHFNLALALHQLGRPDEARKHFELARRYANGNASILDSSLLKQYLNQS